MPPSTVTNVTQGAEDPNIRKVLGSHKWGSRETGWGESTKIISGDLCCESCCSPDLRELIRNLAANELAYSQTSDISFVTVGHTRTVSSSHHSLPGVIPNLENNLKSYHFGTMCPDEYCSIWQENAEKSISVPAGRSPPTAIADEGLRLTVHLHPLWTCAGQKAGTQTLTLTTMLRPRIPFLTLNTPACYWLSPSAHWGFHQPTPVLKNSLCTETRTCPMFP